jgi:hypothetical protein
MARDTVVVSTRSWGPFVDCCAAAWFQRATDKRVHACGPTGRSGNTPIADRQYADCGSFHDVMKKMFAVSLVDKFEILIVFTFTCEFNSLLHARTFLFGQHS